MRRRSLAIVLLCLVLVLVLFCCASTGTRGRWEEHGTACKYWCRMSDHRYHCCPSGKRKDWTGHGWHAIFYPWLWIGAGAGAAAAAAVVDVAVQLSQFHSRWPEASVTERETEKHCPPLRTHCPRTYEWYAPPILCDTDNDCGKSEKCCYDVCLEHKTCKSFEREE